MGAESREEVTLDIGLPVEQLREPIRNCLTRGEKHQQIVLSAINRRGQTIQCRINCNPLISSKSEFQGVILLMEAIEPSIA
ncbi:MAG: hypothetical protein QNJ65_21350 [Xenococcaceae cyanobacterium MO_234.B1]|nr:hypothetical protein [Xenococcaceae cyanobacterium MO_234.B1]